MSAPLDPAAPAAPVIDAARRLLTDTSRCPSCAAVLSGSRCGVCGVDLAGPDGGKVWQLSTSAARLLTERDIVLRGMRARARDAAAAPMAAGRPVLPRSPIGPVSPPPSPPRPAFSSGPARAPFKARPAPRTGGPDVHGLLVGVGALLLAVASVGFLVFSWRVLSLPGRAAVIAITTIGVLAVASWLRGRLPSTAEAVGALGVVLVLADCWAIRRTGLFGADRPEGLGYAAAAAAGSALLLGGWALVSRVRAGSIAAAGLAPLAVVLLAARLDNTSRGAAMGFVLAAALALGRVALPAAWSAERWMFRWIAGGALLVAAALEIGLEPKDAGWAALVLLAAALCAAAQTWADRAGGSLDWLKFGPASVFMRRAWSLGSGLITGAAAIQAGLGLADLLSLHGGLRLLPVTGLTVLAVLLAASIPTRRAVTLRRTAFGAGTAIVAAVTAVPVLLLAGWLPVRVALAAIAGPWAAHPATRLADLGSSQAPKTVDWTVALAALAMITVSARLTGWIAGWPGWLRRPVLRFGALAAVAALVLLPLAPGAPVLAAVIGLAVVAGVLATVLLEFEDHGRFSGLTIKAGWTASALTGSLAVILAWSTRELSVPLTLAGVAALLLARRRAFAGTGPSAAPLSAALAGLAAAAGVVTIGAVAGLAGASVELRITWAGAAGGLLATALLGLPRWLPGGAPGRAVWGGLDRLAAAAPGLAALLLGLLSTLRTGDFYSLSGADGSAGLAGSAWPCRLLLAVALIVCLVGAAASRPGIAGLLPIVPLTSAFAATPVLGQLAVSIRPALPSTLSDALPAALLWAIVAGVGALAVTAGTLAGRAGPGRRVAAELGLLCSGLIAVASVGGWDSLWPVLLVLGAAAAAIGSAPDRRSARWLSAALLLGSTWTRLAVAGVDTVEAYSLPPAAALLALACYRLRRERDADPARALAPAASVGFGPSIVAAAGGSELRPMVLIVVAASLVVAAFELRRRGMWPALVIALVSLGAIVAGTTALLRSGAVLFDLGRQASALSAVEFWTLPAAVIMLAEGWMRLARLESAASASPTGAPQQPTRPTRPSWPAYAPALVVLLLPSFGLGLDSVDGSQSRQLVVLALAGAVLVAGSVRRLQAPVVIGASVLTAQALVLLAPWITQLPTAIPVWGWVAALGLGLLLLGASYERRLRQLRSLRLHLAALR